MDNLNWSVFLVEIFLSFLGLDRHGHCMPSLYGKEHGHSAKYPFCVPWKKLCQSLVSIQTCMTNLKCHSFHFLVFGLTVPFSCNLRYLCLILSTD